MITKSAKANELAKLHVCMYRWIPQAKKKAIYSKSIHLAWPTKAMQPLIANPDRKPL